MDTAELIQLIAGGETLEVEFKGEEKAPLNDRDLVEAVVCLANGKGGRLLVGVEDNGQVTGARPPHGVSTVPAKLASLVRSRTIPALEVRIEEIASGNGSVLLIEVPASSAVVTTTDSFCVRRVMGMRGPECIPYLPHEQPVLLSQGLPSLWQAGGPHPCAWPGYPSAGSYRAPVCQLTRYHPPGKRY